MGRLSNIPLIALVLVIGYIFFSTFSGQTGFAAASCSGNAVLELSPQQVQLNEPITAKVSGLSNCLGQKVILREGSDLCNGQIVKSYICNRPDCNTKTIFYKGHPKTYSITACVDKDNDGYCNWGISDIGLNTSWRNLNCPNSCVNTPNLRKDCNDVDVAIGPFDENFSCKKIFCNDSDNGVNNFLKGFVYTNYNAQNPRTRIYDSCMILTELWIGNFSCSGNECWVQDYYCQGGVRGPYGSLYNCPNGCRNGACI